MERTCPRMAAPRWPATLALTGESFLEGLLLLRLRRGCFLPPGVRSCAAAERCLLGVRALTDPRRSVLVGLPRATGMLPTRC